jgi:hypothetical protein
MDDTPTDPIPTPGRRRPGRNGRAANRKGNAARKGYASENDVGHVETPQYNIATPHTPEKAGENGRATRAKERNKNKLGGQQDGPSTSPEPDRNAQQTTPQRAAQRATSGAGAAFAGATFHASPAPSSLPIPTFMAKAARDSPVSRDTTATAQQQHSPPATDTELPTPQRHSVSGAMSDSPLDFMFKAHREEKQRRSQAPMSADAAHANSPNNSPFARGNFPKATPVAHSSPISARHRSGGPIDDGESGVHYGQPVGAAFSTPYSDRIRAAHSQPRPIPGRESYQQQQHQQQPGQSPAQDPTEALKKFLFSGNNQSPSAPGPNPPSSHGGSWGSPSAVRVNEAPAGAQQGSKSNNIQAMENDLRRILKLDAAGQAADTERRLFPR